MADPEIENIQTLPTITTLTAAKIVATFSNPNGVVVSETGVRYSIDYTDTTVTRTITN